MSIGFRILLPGEAGVGAVAYLGELFGEVQEFLGPVGEELEEGSEADFTLEEGLELRPVRLLRVKGERVLFLVREPA